MNHKHQLFFNGLYITVWGPMSRAKCYQLFLKLVSEKMNRSLTDIAYALQLSDTEDEVTNWPQAYSACSFVHRFVLEQANKPIVLKCDSFLAQPPSFLRVALPPTFPRKPNKGNTPLDELTEILVSRRKLSSVGIISVSRLTSLTGWTNLQSVIRQLMPAPPTIVLVSVILGLFGCLLLPLN